ncbi:hypothetical protein GQ53DRAFT_805176 [Thozetella sp. PMI_491]|nr:hypothetical protein GQ53DRAFT_805176 [Thozetella sp. PMI_491]
MVPRAKARWLAATALANAVAALNVKRPVASPIVAAQITPGPSLEVPELRVRDTVVARAVTVYPCASSCRSSAISEWTTCTPDDLGCTCQAANVLVINFNGAGCLESACGSLSASAVVAASELCLKYEEGRLSMESTVTVSAVVTTDSGGSALSTALNAPKSSSSISFSSSSSNPSSTSSGSNGSGSSANDSSKDGSGQSGLTNGAIAGIAVGSAGGAIILCTIFFLVYKYCIQNRKTTATPPAAQPQEGAFKRDDGIFCTDPVEHAGNFSTS